MTGGTGIDKCYKNNGDETFEDITTSSGFQSSTDGIPKVGVSWGDLNRDGYQDLIVTTEEALIRGINHNGFSAGVAIGDCNQVGWLVLYFTN